MLLSNSLFVHNRLGGSLLFKEHQIARMIALSALFLVTVSCGKNDPAGDTNSNGKSDEQVSDAGIQQDSHETEGHSLVIRDIDGTDLITHDDILAYNAETHVLKLVPGTREKISPSQSLITGSPFTIVVDGKVQYSGRFTTSLSSQSIDNVVIDLFAPGLEDDQIQISLGYPTRTCYTAEDDPRENKNVIGALRAMDKIGG